MDEKDPKDLTDDTAFARVRAADPAADVVPDTVALRAVVDERRAAPGVPDELAARRARRWTGWPAKVAGIAAAALIVGGGGGYAIGAAGGDDGPTMMLADDSAAPAMSLGGAAGAGDTGAEEDQALAPQVAPGGASSERVGGGDAAYWGGWGRTVFTPSGLSDAGTVLHGYALDAASVFSEQTIATAAAALGVAGTPQLVDGSWIVGSTDGSGPTVQMYADGTGSISYWDPTKDVWNCVDVGLAEESKADASSEIEPPAPDPCQERDLGPAPQGDAAIQALSDVLAALGLDPTTYQATVEDYGDTSQQYSYVTAFHVLNGQRTGLAWSASFTGAGMTSLNGSVAPLVDIGEYQVVSPVEAVARLGDPRFGAGYPMYAMDAGADVAMEGGTTSEAAPVTPTVPPTAAVGSRVSWPVYQATIVEARLGLAQHWQGDGSVVLVPTYELSSADGGVWTVIAVADSQLDFTATR